MKKPRIRELKKWFDDNVLPDEFRFADGSKIADMDKFVDSHFSFLQSPWAKGNKAYMPYYNRLFEVYNKLKK